MKANPDHLPPGYRLLKDGETITNKCKMWSMVNEIWIDVSEVVIGRKYDRLIFISTFAIPI